jgi:hypothetical protein
MTTQQTKKMLTEKQTELKARQVRREDIAIVKNAEVLDGNPTEFRSHSGA